MGEEEEAASGSVAKEFFQQVFGAATFGMEVWGAALVSSAGI